MATTLVDLDSTYLPYLFAQFSMSITFLLHSINNCKILYRQLRINLRYLGKRLLGSDYAIWVVDGFFPQTQTPIRLIVAGCSMHVNRINSIYCGKIGNVQKIKAMPRIGIEKETVDTCKKIGADAAFWEPWPWQISLNRKDIFFTHLDAVLDLDLGVDLEGHLGKITSKRFRRKALDELKNLSPATFASDDKCLEIYYESLLKPYSIKRHGPKAFVESLASLKFQKAIGEEKVVMLLSEGDKVVAGGLLIYSKLKREVSLHSYAVIPEYIDEPERMETLFVAMNLHFLGMAISRKAIRANFGATISVLNDGINFYKKRWGFRFEVNPAFSIPGNITFFRFTPKKRALLLYYCPIPIFENNQIVGLSALPEGGMTIAEAKEYVSRIVQPEMKRLEISIPSDLSSEVEAYLFSNNRFACPIVRMLPIDPQEDLHATCPSDV